MGEPHRFINDGRNSCFVGGFGGQKSLDLDLTVIATVAVQRGLVTEAQWLNELL